jgi:deazaflavin-dependent oxidoreductase (nitroreductase family)
VQITLLSTGARSGKPRRATLYAWEDGDRLVLVGSRGGAKRNPAWVHNLRAHPETVVVRGRSERRYRATEATGAERERLWRIAADRFPLYDRYAERTDRRIPVFLLEPID